MVTLSNDTISNPYKLGSPAIDHMMACNCLRLSFVCVSAAAERSQMSKILLLRDSD